MADTIDLLIQTDSNVFNEAVITKTTDYIMLHSACVSAQWPIEDIGVQLTKQGKGIIKLGFMAYDGMGYQSFYFKESGFEDIEEFFKKLGFPMPREANIAYGKSNLT